MERIPNTIVTLLLGGTLGAQEVVSTAGQEHILLNKAITYTIGEPVINTGTGTNAVLTQGFNQPWVAITTTISGPTPYTVSVHPNPTRHVLHLNITEPVQGLRYAFLDAGGALVLEGPVTDRLTILDVERYASGSYLLRVFDAQHPTLHAFKINITH